MTENDKGPVETPAEETGTLPDDKTLSDKELGDKELGDMARRRFLETCGTFAVVTPPAILAMMTVAPKRASAAPSTFPGVGWGTDGDPPDEEGQYPGPGGFPK